MPSNNSLKNEEIRGLFVLGLLAVLASIRIQSGNIHYFYTIGRLTFDVISLLDFIIATWSFYAFFMVVGLSEDVVGKTISDTSRGISKLFLYVSFITLAIFSSIIFYFAYQSSMPYFLVLIIIPILFGLFNKLRKSKKLSKSYFKEWFKLKLSKLSQIFAIIYIFCTVAINFFSDEYILTFFITGLVCIVIYIILKYSKL